MGRRSAPAACRDLGGTSQNRSVQCDLPRARSALRFGYLAVKATGLEAERALDHLQPVSGQLVPSDGLNTVPSGPLTIRCASQWWNTICGEDLPPIHHSQL